MPLAKMCDFRVCPEFPNLAEFDGRGENLGEGENPRVLAVFGKAEKRKVTVNRRNG